VLHDSVASRTVSSGWGGGCGGGAVAIVLHAGLETLGGMSGTLGPSSPCRSCCSVALVPLGAALMTIVGCFHARYRERRSYWWLVLIVPTYHWFWGVRDCAPTRLWGGGGGGVGGGGGGGGGAGGVGGVAVPAQQEFSNHQSLP